MKKIILLFSIVLNLSTALFAQSNKNQTKSMTLLAGTWSMNARYLFLKEDAGDSTYGTVVDSCFTSEGIKQSLWQGAEPPLQINPNFLNKKFQVSYLPDLVDLPGDQTVAGIRILKMTLTK